MRGWLYKGRFKVHGLTLLLGVGTLWKSSDSLFFKVHPLASDVLLTTPTSWKCAADCWSLQNFLPQSSCFMVGKAQKSHGVRSGLYGRCSDWVPLIHFFQAKHRIQFTSYPMQFLGFSNYEEGAPRQEISKWSTVCSMFSRSGWSIVRSVSLANGSTSKKRPSPHLHKIPTWSNKVSPWTLQTALIYCKLFRKCRKI
jgi:hypothetical protein